MTVSPDARTPSATVHALSGSTPPGAAPIMQPFGVAAGPATVAEMPDPFIPLGAAAAGVAAGLAARRAAAVHPDAAVIDLADRVVRLNAREDRLVLRTVEIEDAVFRSMPPRPKEAEGVLHIAFHRSVEDDGARVTTMRAPAGWAAEVNANRVAHAAALAERERQEQDEEARRGLPRWNKLRERATARLDRWGLQLAAMEPVTQAGVAAKAAAAKAVAEGDELPDGWRQKLALSLSRDALRVIGAECDARYEDVRRDGPLLDLIARYRPARQRYADAAGVEQEAADEALTEIEDAIAAIAPRTVAGLAAKAAWVSERDPRHETSIPKTFIRQVAAFGEGALVAPLGRAAAGPEPIAAMLRRATDLRRRIDAGIPDDDAADRAADEMFDLQQRAGGTPIGTAGGATAVLDWVRDEFDAAYVRGGKADPLDVLMLGFIDRALDVLRRSSGDGAPASVVGGALLLAASAA